MRNKLHNLKLSIILLAGIIAGVILSPVFLGIASAYGERDGSWTATEKRQVIQFLREIRDNTQ